MDHICSKEAEISVLSNEQKNINKDIERIDAEMMDIKNEIRLGFKGINSNIIGAMGFIISILLTALGVFVYNSITK
jgi:hypothetical protein